MSAPKKPAKKDYLKMTAKELEVDVRYHNYRYFSKDDPLISDYEFDQHVERLKELMPSSKVLQEIPTEGAERPKVKHSSPMLSLEKAYSAEEVEKWADKFEGDLISSPKIDGLAVEIRYDKDGRLALAATRGDGIQGELITENIRAVSDIPQKLPAGDLEIRGEVYMRLSVFNKQYRDQFANPRNLAAGAVKQKDPSKTKEYQLSFFAYGLDGGKQKGELEKYEQLKQWKIPVVEHRRIKRDAIESTYQYFLSQRDQYDYETDGVVFRVDSVAEQERLGATAHHPRWSIAYKYQGESGVTTLQDVEWSVARTGVITPIGIVDPVELSGAMVSRVSLHKYGFMSEKKLRKGAKVVMVRRGGVIPYLESVQTPGKGPLFKAPTNCPSCGSPAEIRDEFLYCTNKKSCAGSRIAELEHFIKTVEIDGFGPKLIERLYESEFVTEMAAFYDLTKETLLELERMGDKLASKLIRNIVEKKKLDLDILIAALGIREIGRQVAKALAGEFKSYERLVKATEEELTAVEMVGPVIAKEFIEGVTTRKDSIKRLLKQVKIKSVESRASTGKLAGMKFCFTGTMLAMSRGEAQKKVEALGGNALSSVTKDLDYLVVGSEGKAGSKPTKANKIADEGGKVKLIGEAKFLKLIGM